MQVTFLGTGTSQGVPLIGCHCQVCSSPDPRDKRLRTSVMAGINGQTIVIDAGPDFRQQMLAYKVESLRAILLTHEHVDHIFGLDDIRSYNWLQKKPTDIYAEKRVQQAIRRIFHYVFARYKYPGIPQMTLHEVDSQPFLIDDIPVVPVRCFHHKLPVLGYRIGNFSYLTDINRMEDKEMIKIEGSDILVVNALRIEKHISHFNLEQALAFIAQAKPTTAYLTHISHAMGRYADVEKMLPENVHLAYDGLTITI